MQRLVQELYRSCTGLVRKLCEAAGELYGTCTGLVRKMHGSCMAADNEVDGVQNSMRTLRELHKSQKQGGHEGMWQKQIAGEYETLP